MNTPLIRRPDGNGASAEAVPAVPAATSVSDEYPLLATWRGIGAQAAAALGMLTGLWVAISPWFITLQYACGNAAAVNLISGLAGPPSAPSPWQARAGSPACSPAARCLASG